LLYRLERLLKLDQNSDINSGFSLIELLVTIAILAILLAVAVPSFATYLDRSKVDTVSMNLKSDLVSARSEASKTGFRTTLCASDDEQQCSGTFSQGWIVFRDTNGDGTVNNNESILKVSGRIEAGTTVKALAGDDSSVTQMVYNYRGFLNSELTVEVSRNNSSQILDLKKSGRVVLK